MSSLRKSIGIIIGLIVLIALVFFVVPRVIGTINTQSTVQSTDLSEYEDSAGVIAFRDFQEKLAGAAQYSFCATKSVIGKESDFELYFGCTIRGDDYAIKTVAGNIERRQLYVDGKYTYIEDNEKKVYADVQVVDFPNTHLQQAITGKVIDTYGEIIKGYQANCVQIYKDGRVYAYYFDQQGELVRVYYIYDGNEITIDFCGFFFGNGSQFAAFSVPSTYLKGVWDPSDMTD